jgi:hypothetical protein
MTAKVAVRTHGGVQYIWYYCPGCKHNHGVPSAAWSWNGSVESPSLHPSVLHFIPAGKHGPEQTVCHYFITNGKIAFCSDSKHDLKSQSVEMQEPTNVPENSSE